MFFKRLQNSVLSIERGECKYKNLHENINRETLFNNEFVEIEIPNLIKPLPKEFLQFYKTIEFSRLRMSIIDTFPVK